MKHTIHVDRLLPHPPARVWTVLTGPASMSQWLMPTDFRPELGATFTLDAGQWGKVSCEVLALEPERLLSFAWRNSALDTTVTFRLEPEGEGTRLFVAHAGFDLDDPVQKFAFGSMSGGWGGVVFDRLARMVSGIDT